MRKAKFSELVVFLGAVALSVVATDAAGAEVGTSSGAGGPCYVVIAVDVSGSMERADVPRGDARRRQWTLRDEGQLVLMQLLPYMYSDLHVGVCHFSDRVRYALPSEETGPLLAWGNSYLSEAACRNLVRPAEFTGSYQTDIADGLDWALERIRAARRKYGDGPGKVLLLSHGDPRDSSKELAGEGPLFAAGARLAEQDVRVYPIIINKASARPGSELARLSASERTAEGVMLSLAAMTGGRGYRLTAETGFPDVLLDVFGLGTPLTGRFGISPYDWAVVTVGRPNEPVTIAPSAPGGESPRVGLGSDSEITSRTVPSTQWPVTVYRRPDGEDAIDRSWKGHWVPTDADGQIDATVRAYRIPDFLVKLEAEPEFPWWIHQRGQVTARLLDRHADRRKVQETDSAGGADGLSVRLAARSKEQGQSAGIGEGRWAVPGGSYGTGSFTLPFSGPYDLSCELLYRLGDGDVSLVTLTEEVQVYPACVGIDILSADEAKLGALPETSGGLSLTAAGGQQVRFRVTKRGAFNTEPVTGVLHLAPLEQNEWALRKADMDSDLDTGLVQLPEDEDRVTGWAELEVETPGGTRQFRLPDFELVYRPAPLRIDCAFGEPREALWVGEYHRQLLTISAFPVFDSARDQVVAMFPEGLSTPEMRTVDLQSGTVQVTSPAGRLIEVPKPVGAKGRTLAATYALESSVPIPSGEKCEIRLDGTIPDLSGAVQTYAVVDPVADGLFTWTVDQGSTARRGERVSEILYCGEPVEFSAQWRADQNVSAVRFEIPRPEPNEPFTVDLPIPGKADEASIEPTLPQLGRGQTYPVHVYVTMRPSSDAPAIEVKLSGGQFRAEDRRLILEELVVGAERGRDIPSRAWEPVEIPLRAVFSGYLPGDPQHSAMIEQFKSLCTLTVTSSTGAVEDISGSVEWTSLVVAEAEARRSTTCELEGRVFYAPQHTGRATVDVKAQFAVDEPGQAGAARRAYGHLSVRAPRLVVSVQKVTPGGAAAVFDSQAWVRETGGLFPVAAGFSTRLRVVMRAAGWASIPQSEPLDITLSVLRRSKPEDNWSIESSQDQELTAQGALTHEVQVSTDGQYALEIVGKDRASGQVVTRLLTPVVTSIQRYKAVSVLSPPAWITPRVREWPFEYRVTLHGERGDLTQASLSFQFQLPGEDPVWFEGSTRAAESETTDAQSLVVRSPDLLPALPGLSDGAVYFRLAAHGLELLSWEFPNVRVLAPVLERLALNRGESGPEIEVVDGETAWNGSSALVVRPVFRAAPELAGQWVRAKTIVYVWPYEGDTLPGNQGPLLMQQKLKGGNLAATGDSDCQAFTIEGSEPGQAVEILPQRLRFRFWGWPRSGVSQRYAVVASTQYRAQEAEGDAATQPRQTLAEWTDVYTINLELPRVIPWCWWLLAAVVLYLVCVAVFQHLACYPDKLGLDVRLEESVALVEPASPAGPVHIALHPTPLGTDVKLYARYLGGRWEEAGRSLAPLVGPVVGKLLRCLALVVAPVRVLVRRCVLPRWWAWALITPKTGSDKGRTQSGLLCVWTSPLARARAWSSETGSFELPGKGQAKSITLDLPYQIEQSRRTMRVSVKLRNTAPEGADAASGSTHDDGDEFEFL